MRYFLVFALFENNYSNNDIYKCEYFPNIKELEEKFFYSHFSNFICITGITEMSEEDYKNSEYYKPNIM